MGADNDEAASHRLHEIVTVFVLSVTAVLTAWCGFEASKWGGEMSISFSRASSARIQAADFDGQARDSRQFDLTIYAQWVTATASNQPDLAQYIENRFTPAFAIAFDAWEAGGMQEPSPFGREEYVPEGAEDAVTWSATADSQFDKALDNNQRGDNYSLLTVLFALVLFLTAMSQRHASTWSSRVLLGLGIIAGVVGVVIMATFPVLV